MSRVLGEKGIRLAKQYRAKGLGLKEAVAKARRALYRPHQPVGIQGKHRVTSVLNCFFCQRVETKRVTFHRMRPQNNKYIPGAAITAPVCIMHRMALGGPDKVLHCGEFYQGF